MDEYGINWFVSGCGSAMRILGQTASEIAPTNIPILIVGESGTGKEMLAREIHRQSSRRGEAFKKLSCATLHPEFFVPQLGKAGTNGDTQNDVSAGTMFFDEISELDAPCQRILLHTLPEGESAGDSEMLFSRVISATCQNLDEEVRAGRFRRELYYRINGVCLRLPPLRERREDIPTLVEFFLMKHSTLLHRPRPSVSMKVTENLLEYSWPGNIRELENVVKKIVVLGNEEMAVADLASVDTKPTRHYPQAQTLSLKAAARAASWEAERELILKALERTHWNRKRAAQELQISYKALLYKLKQIGALDHEARERL